MTSRTEKKQRTQLAVDTRHEVSQHVGADHAVHLQEKLDREGDDNEEWEGVDQMRIAEAGDEAPWIAGRHHLSGGPGYEE